LWLLDLGKLVDDFVILQYFHAGIEIAGTDWSLVLFH